MTTQPKHTPTPWIDDACLDAQGFVTIRRADGIEHGDTETAVIATVYDADTAAFIVTACNAHEELLAACQHAAVSEHHPACKAHGEYSANPERYCTCHVQKARAAIAKAEGR